MPYVLISIEYAELGSCLSEAPLTPRTYELSSESCRARRGGLLDVSWRGGGLLDRLRLGGLLDRLRRGGLRSCPEAGRRGGGLLDRRLSTGERESCRRLLEGLGLRAGRLVRSRSR